MRNHRFGLSAVKSVVLVLGLLAASRALVANLGSPHDSGTTKPKTTPVHPSSTSEGAKAAAAHAYEALPLGFEPNVGQTDPSVQFLSHGPGYTVFLQQNQAVIALEKMSPKHRKLFETTRLYRGSTRFRSARKKKVTSISIVGAASVAKAEPLDELPGKSNYFLGNDPSKWQRGVSTYRRVKYAGMYPGVDLVYYGKQGQLEFDFIVAPNADAGSINLRVEGDGVLRIAKDGGLVLKSADGSFQLHRPDIYQMYGPQKRVVKGGFVLRGKNQVGIRVSRYDHSQPLIVDPALSYSTYLGGSGTDYAFGVALDANNNPYIVGQTTSTNFPTANAYSTSSNSNGIAFVSKINTTGAALLYSTYLGGTGGEAGLGIAVDLIGRAYVTGTTMSSDFPLVNAFQSTLGSTSGNVFVSIINSSQTGVASLVYSTYLGGGGFFGDQGWAIAVDSIGLAYVTGETSSDASTTPFPTTSTAFQSTLTSENGNAFLTVLDPSQTGGAELVYSTYLGGSSTGLGDVGLSVAVDQAGNAYLAGMTASVTPTPFPTTTGAFQSSTNSQYGSTFVAEIATTQSGNASLAYSTYLGGSGDSTDGIGDEAFGVALDSSGKVYVTGMAVSSDFPVTAGAFQTTNNGTSKAFLSKLDPTQAGAQSLVYSTFLGGSTGDYAHSVTVDGSGNAYAAGVTISTDFPTTAGAFQTSQHGYLNSFLAAFNSTGTGLLYGTYLGGSCSVDGDGDIANSVVLDGAGNPYVAGSTCSSDFPVYPSNPYQTSLVGSDNAFVTKFAFFPNPSIAASVLPSPNAAGWNNSALTVTFTCTPGPAPIQSCSPPVMVRAEGANQVISRHGRR